MRKDLHLNKINSKCRSHVTCYQRTTDHVSHTQHRIRKLEATQSTHESDKHFTISDKFFLIFNAASTSNKFKRDCKVITNIRNSLQRKLNERIKEWRTKSPKSLEMGHYIHFITNRDFGYFPRKGKII